MLTLVTNRHLCGEEVFIEKVVSAIHAGVHQVILREKDLDTDALIEIGRLLKHEMTGTQKLIVSTDIQAAHGLNAYGVQLTYEAFMTLSQSKIDEIQGAMNLKVGVSVHGAGESILASQKGADYLLAGHVFETDCKAGLAGRGTDFIRSLARNSSIPVIAIGGITKDNLESVLKAGASGIAVMSSVMCSKNVEQTCSELLSVIQRP